MRTRKGWLHNHCRVCHKFVLDRDEYITLQHLMAASQRAPISDGNDSVRRRLEHREADPALFAPGSRTLCFWLLRGIRGLVSESSLNPLKKEHASLLAQGQIQRWEYLQGIAWSTFGVRCGVPGGRAAILIKSVASESDSSEHERPSIRTRRSHALTDADAADFARTCCFLYAGQGGNLHVSSQKENVGEDYAMECHRFDPNPFAIVVSDSFEHQTKSLALLPCPDCAPLSLQGGGGRGSRTSHMCAGTVTRKVS